MSASWGTRRPAAPIPYSPQAEAPAEYAQDPSTAYEWTEEWGDMEGEDPYATPYDAAAEGTIDPNILDAELDPEIDGYEWNAQQAEAANRSPNLDSLLDSSAWGEAPPAPAPSPSPPPMQNYARPIQAPPPRPIAPSPGMQPPALLGTRRPPAPLPSALPALPPPPPPLHGVVHHHSPPPVSTSTFGSEWVLGENEVNFDEELEHLTSPRKEEPMASTWVPDRRAIRSVHSERSILGSMRSTVSPSRESLMGTPPPMSTARPPAPVPLPTEPPPRPSHSTFPGTTPPPRSRNEPSTYSTFSPESPSKRKEARQEIAPFNFQEPPFPVDPQQRQEELRTLVKRLWVPGTLNIATHTWRGQTYDNCFVAQDLLNYLERTQKLSLPLARDTIRDLHKMQYIIPAVNLEPGDDRNLLLYRLSMPTGAIPGQATIPIKPVQNSSSPQLASSPQSGFLSKILKRETTSPDLRSNRPGSGMMASPPNFSAGGSAPGSSNRPKTLEVRERPAKFLRRTTQEQAKLQAERAREANWIPQELRGDWDESVWENTNDLENKAIELVRDPQGKPVVEAGTLNALVRHLTSELTDMTYTKTFFVTYKAFVTPQVLLPKLIQRFHVPPDVEPLLAKTFQVRTINALLKWLELAPNDWDQDLVDRLDEFTRELANNPDSTKKSFATKLQNAIIDVLEGKDKELRAAPLTPAPPPILPKIRGSGLALFFDLDVLEIARQMTLMDWKIFSRIKPVELLNCAWSSDKLKHRSPNVLAVSHTFNKWSNWVATIICIQPNVKVRAKVMQKFIDIAWHLRKLNNFSSCIAILSGLNNAAIFRLNKTKEAMKEKYHQKYEELIPVVDTGKSHKNYREALKSSPPPKIPHLAVFLTDLIFINEGNKDVCNERLVNFRKHQMVYDVILQIRQCQLDTFNLEPVPFIQEFLTLRDEQMRTDKQLYDQSLLIEPRESAQTKD